VIKLFQLKLSKADLWRKMVTIWK